MEQHTGNIPGLTNRSITLQPRIPGKEKAFQDYCRLVSRLVKVADEARMRQVLEEARDEIKAIGGAVASGPDVALKFACSVVVDMVAQGWTLSVTDGRIDLIAPTLGGVSPNEVKRRVRDGHLLERDAQLREPSVREFVTTMERRRLGPNGWVSIFSLMRDGRELARELEVSAKESDSEERLRRLRSEVAPYLQIVESGAICEHTGIKLTDIWRYFRHTWVSTYKSMPGRSMMILVRDAAAPSHPVIGIAALGSSMAQQTLRDEWIGWDSKKFVEELTCKATGRMCRWVFASIERLLGGIYLGDLLREGVIERSDIRKASDTAIKRLLLDAEKAAKQHRLFPSSAEHKNNTNGNMLDDNTWRMQAESALFRSKRARTLATLLGIRAALAKSGLTETTAESLRKALTTSGGRRAIRQLVRLVKAEHVGVDMMDIIVCGAVAPYNVLLGGKLVCMLLTSPEIISAYRRRYARHPSIIASSMKGRAVVRTPNLAFFGTTSLFGVGSSQYNRLRIPLDELGGTRGGRIEYVELGPSKGYGSYHFSQATIDYVETLLGRTSGGRKVNSIFGEGVNPLIRKLRDGLAAVGLPTDDLLRHGNTRVVYAVSLADNFREVLLGLSSTPRYLVPRRSPKKQTQRLADYWIRRWLFARIAREDVLTEVAQHALTYPISHGARVPLPEKDEPNLFISP